MSGERVIRIARALLPAPVSAKSRLQATLAEMSRAVETMPEPACALLASSGLVSSWRAQIETLANAGRAVTTAGDVIRVARQVLSQVQAKR